MFASQITLNSSKNQLSTLSPGFIFDHHFEFKKNNSNMIRTKSKMYFEHLLYAIHTKMPDAIWTQDVFSQFIVEYALKCVNVSKNYGV